MKTHPIYHPILLICALLLGTVAALRADVTTPTVPAPTPGARIEQKPGIFSRFFGRIAERLGGAKDDDDDDQRFRPRGQQSPFPPPATGTTVITTTTNLAPIRSEHLVANRYPPVPVGTRSIAPSSSRSFSVSREVHPAAPAPPVLLAEHYPRAPEEIRTAIVSASTVVANAPTVVLVQTLPASRRFPVSPPRSAPLVPSALRSATLSLQQQPQLVPSASIRAPVAPSAPTTPTSSSSLFANRIPIAVTPSQGPPSANPPSAEPPAPPPLPPFGSPVPGRRGLVYPPGQEATPENMIDVTDYAPGTKVRDPISKTVFRVPWSS